MSKSNIYKRKRLENWKYDKVLKRIPSVLWLVWLTNPVVQQIVCPTLTDKWTINLFKPTLTDKWTIDLFKLNKLIVHLSVRVGLNKLIVHLSVRVGQTICCTTRICPYESTTKNKNLCPIEPRRKSQNKWEKADL